MNVSFKHLSKRVHSYVNGAFYLNAGPKTVRLRKHPCISAVYVNDPAVIGNAQNQSIYKKRSPKMNVYVNVQNAKFFT